MMRLVEEGEQRDPCANNILGQVYSKNRISVNPDEFIDIPLPPSNSETLDSTLLTSKFLQHKSTLTSRSEAGGEKRHQSLSERKFRRKSAITNVLRERTELLRSSASTSDICSMFSGRSEAFSKAWSNPDKNDAIERWTGQNLQNDRQRGQKHTQFRSRHELLVNLKNMQQSIMLLNKIVSTRSNVPTLNTTNSLSRCSMESSRCGSACSIRKEEPVTLLPYKDPPLAYRISSPCRSDFRTLSIISRYKRHTRSRIPDDISTISFDSSSSENEASSHVNDSFKLSNVEMEYRRGNVHEKVRENIRSNSSESKRSHDRAMRIRRSQEYLDEFKNSKPLWMMSDLVPVREKQKSDLVPVREKQKSGQINKVCLENWLGSSGCVAEDVVCPMHSTVINHTPCRASNQTRSTPSIDGDELQQKFEWLFSTRDLESDNSTSPVTNTRDLESDTSTSPVTNIEHVSPVNAGSLSHSSITTSAVMDDYMCNCHFGEMEGYCIVHSDCDKLNIRIPSTTSYDYEDPRYDDSSTLEIDTNPRPDSTNSIIRGMKTVTYGQADLSFTFDSSLTTIQDGADSTEVEEVTVKRDSILPQSYQTTKDVDVLDTTDSEDCKLKTHHRLLNVSDENSDCYAELDNSYDTNNSNISEEINSAISTAESLDIFLDYREVYDSDTLSTVARKDAVKSGDEKNDDDKDDGSSLFMSDARSDEITSYRIINKNTDCMIEQSELILEISEEISDENITHISYNDQTSSEQLRPEISYETDSQLYEDETLPPTPTQMNYLELPKIKILEDYKRILS